MFLIKLIASYIFFPVIFLYTKFLQMKFPIQFYSEEETRAKIIQGGSISRFGDGEFAIALYASMRNQNYNRELAKRLREILSIDMTTTPGFYVAINAAVGTYKGYTIHNVRFWSTFNSTHLPKIYQLLNRGQRYYDACAFRIMDIKYDDINTVKRRIDEIKEIWRNKKLLIVEADFEEQSALGENLCLGVNNDFLSEAADVQRIIAPAKNAYSKYDEILDAICRSYEHDVVLLVLGITATVLAYDLYSRGIRAIDFGQTTRSYVHALEKYFDDEPRGKIISLEEWKSQIIERIEDS